MRRSLSRRRGRKWECCGCDPRCWRRTGRASVWHGWPGGVRRRCGSAWERVWRGCCAGTTLAGTRWSWPVRLRPRPACWTSDLAPASEYTWVMASVVCPNIACCFNDTQHVLMNFLFPICYLKHVYPLHHPVQDPFLSYYSPRFWQYFATRIWIFKLLLFTTCFTLSITPFKSSFVLIIQDVFGGIWRHLSILITYHILWQLSIGTPLTGPHCSLVILKELTTYM